MNVVEVVRDAAADLVDRAGHHVPEASLALGLFTLVLTQVQTFRFRRKAAIETRAKAVAEVKAQEIDRSAKLVAALRDIGEAKDSVVLGQAVAIGRTLANKPAPVDYQMSLFSLDRGSSKVPVIDKDEERFRVERKYYGNPCAEIPRAPRTFSQTDSFPRDIPKEWYPSLVDAIIETLPARFPSYYSIAEAESYGMRSPKAVIRRIARLSEAVEQQYLRVSQREITEFLVHIFADHWSKLADTIRSVLMDREQEFLDLGSDFLHFAAGRTIHAYRPQLVRLAIVQGVSEAVYYMRERISVEQKESLASAYTSLLQYNYLNSLGLHRFWHESAYCAATSWEVEECDDNVAEVGRFEVVEDHVKGYISIDRVLTSAVLAMGIVSPDSPPNPHGGPGHLTMRIVEHLPKVFESYREDPRMKRRLKDSGSEIPWESELDHTHVGDFVEGIYQLTQKRNYRPEVYRLIESASILVPDIPARIDKMNGEEATIDG